MSVSRTVSQSRTGAGRTEDRLVRAVAVCPDCHSPVTTYGCSPTCRGLDTD